MAQHNQNCVCREMGDGELVVVEVSMDQGLVVVRFGHDKSVRPCFGMLVSKKDIQQTHRLNTQQERNRTECRTSKTAQRDMFRYRLLQFQLFCSMRRHIKQWVYWLVTAIITM